MARYTHTSPAFDFFQPTPDCKPVFSRDEEMNILDEKILDGQDGADGSRRVPSTPTTGGDASGNMISATTDNFSRRGSVWSDMAQQQSDSQSQYPSQLSTPLFEPVNNSFVSHVLAQQQQQQQHQQQQQQQPWNSLPTDSGSCTPTPIYEHFPLPVYDGAMGSEVRPVPLSASSSSHMALRVSPPATFGVPNSAPMSPESSQGWSASLELSEASSVSKSNRNSSSYRSGSGMNVRRDGIRKKNTRFDIPSERTLGNIDLLINRSNDEDEIKELKQQKRLLRNRQAALDSRQRKKIHTEQLEEDKRRSSSLINELQEALQEMKLRESNLVREKTELVERQQQLHHYLEQMHVEKGELIRAHTLETGELRKKNNILREHMERMEASIHSPQAPEPSMRNQFFDYDHMFGGNPSWSPFPVSGGFDFDSECPQTPSPIPTPASRFNPSTKPTEKPAGKAATTTDASAVSFSWNAFYMCLLFGAFIASNSTPTSQPAIPALSEEYRSESANVLRAVLASGPSQSSPANPTMTSLVRSASSAGGPPSTISGREMAQMSSSGLPSNLDNLHHNLVAPTKEQEDAQAFALTAERYRSLTTFDDDEMGNPEHPPTLSNLQQAYAAMRNNDQQSRAAIKGTSSDVYSRSLLWDHIPEKVLQDFRKMVKECGADVDPKIEKLGKDMCRL